MRLQVIKGHGDYLLHIKDSLASVSIPVNPRGEAAHRVMERAVEFGAADNVKMNPDVEAILNEIEEVIHVSKMGGSSHTLVSRLTTIVNNHRSNKSVGD